MMPSFILHLLSCGWVVKLLRPKKAFKIKIDPGGCPKQANLSHGAPMENPAAGQPAPVVPAAVATGCMTPCHNHTAPGTSG